MMMDFTSFRRGDGLIVRCGARGTQYARVVSWAPDGASMRVQKWLDRGQRWTKNITIYPADALRRSTPAEDAKRR